MPSIVVKTKHIRPLLPLDTCCRESLFYHKPSFGSLYMLHISHFELSQWCGITLTLPFSLCHTTHKYCKLLYNTLSFLTHYLVVEGISIMPLRLSELNMNLDTIMVIPLQTLLYPTPTKNQYCATRNPTHMQAPMRKKSIAPYNQIKGMI